MTADDPRSAPHEIATLRAGCAATWTGAGTPLLGVTALRDVVAAVARDPDSGARHRMTRHGRWSWFAAGLFAGIVLLVVVVWLLFLGFGFNV